MRRSQVLKERKIHPDNIEGLYDYFDHSEIGRFFNGRGYITASQVYESSLTTQDKIWLLSNRCFVPVERFVDLFIEFVMRIIPIWQTYHPDGNCSNILIGAKERYQRGEISEDEMIVDMYDGMRTEERVPFFPSLEEPWEVIIRWLGKTVAYIRARKSISRWEEEFQKEQEWQLNAIMEIMGYAKDTLTYKQ
jgi:hypothetical protein